jgi:hypothetical protein
LDLGDPPARTWPRKLAPIAGFLATLAIVPAIFLVWSYSTFGSPRVAIASLRGDPLSVARPSVRLAPAKVGTRRDISFRVWNLSTRPITIVGGTSSCTCFTTARLPAEIPIGSPLDLGATVNYTDKPGPIDQAITYYTDHPGMPRFTVRVSTGVAP